MSRCEAVGSIGVTEFLTKERVRLYSWALVIAILVAFLATVTRSQGSSAPFGRLGGDLPAFYSAGTIASRGDWGLLYDWSTQQEAQRGLFGETQDAFLPFAYPPFVAAAYAPLAALPYRLAASVHFMIMLAALALALAMMRGLLAVVEEYPTAVFAGSLAFLPMTMSIGNGQNTAFILLLLVAIWRSLASEQEVRAGVFAALLLFKPQVAVPVLGLLLVRHWRAALGAVPTAGALYLAGLPLLGAGWPVVWFQQAIRFGFADQATNGVASIDFFGFALAVFGQGAGPWILSGLAVAALAGYSARKWAAPDVPLGLLMGLMAICVALIPPHTQWYVAGVLVLPLAVMLDRALSRGAAPGRTLFAIGGVLVWSLLAGPFSSRIGFSIMFPAVVLVGLWLVSIIGRDAGRETAGSGR